MIYLMQHEKGRSERRSALWEDEKAKKVSEGEKDWRRKVRASERKDLWKTCRTESSQKDNKKTWKIELNE